MNNSSYLNDSFSVPGNITVAPGSSIAGAIIGCIVFLLCLLTVTSIILAKSLRDKEKVCYLAIISSDLVFSCQILLVRLLPIGGISYTSEHPLCQFQLWNGILLGLVSIFSNMMVTTERFVSVVLPFRFSEKVTSKRLIVVYTFLWVTSIILTFAMFSDGFSGGTLCQFLSVGSRQSYAILGTIICSIVILDFCLYVCIIKVARRHIRQIAATMVDGNSAGTERASYIKKKEFRATLTVGIITLAFGISYFPLGVYLSYYGILSSLTIDSSMFNVMITLLMINSLVNPVIYIWRLKSCRQEMINRILCRPNEVTENDHSRITTNNG